MEEVNSFLGSSVVNSAIGIVGIVLAIVGIFSYKKSRQHAKPCVQTFSLGLLGRHDDELPDGVTVHFHKTEVRRLTKTVVVFWNAGNDVLQGHDVVPTHPIAIEFDAGNQILSFEIVKQTKEENGVVITQDPTTPNRVEMSLEYLDPGDGVTIELLHDSEKRYPKVLGTIKGLPKGILDLGRVQSNVLPYMNAVPIKWMFSPKFVFSVAIFFGVTMMITGLLPDDIRTAMTDRLSNFFQIKADNDASDSSIALVLGGLFYAAIPGWLLWIRRKRFPRALAPAE